MHTIHVTEPRELLALVPYQLGFQPADSLVVISLRGERSRVGLIARVDLARGASAAASLARHVVDDGATSAVVVVYTDSDQGAHDTALAASQALAGAGLPVRSWWVTGGDYRPMLPEFPEATPAVGRPIADLQCTEVAATFVAGGTSPLATRADLNIEPAGAAARAQARAARALALDEAGEDLPAWRRAGVRLWLEARTGAPSPTLAGRVAAALDTTPTRDGVLCSMIPGGDAIAEDVAAGEQADAVSTLLDQVLHTGGHAPDPDVLDPAVTLLTYVAAHVESAPARTLLGFAAWWQGQGARASVHLDAALVIDPQYRLASLLTGMLEAALPPGWARPAA